MKRNGFAGAQNIDSTFVLRSLRSLRSPQKHVSQT